MAETATVRVLFLGDAGSALRSTNLLQRSFGSLGRAAKIAGVAIVAGVVTSMVSATNAAIDFDRSMRNVNSLLKLSERQFASLSTEVLALAKETGQAPKTLADGLYDIAGAGFQAADAVKILRVSARAATAGLTDTATAAKAINAALNAYKLGAEEAGDVSDVLFKTVEKGVLTFEELAQNMGDLVPVAAPLGVTLEEVGAAIATITLSGVPAAEAATRVKNTMLQLANPSEALTDLLRDQGYETGRAAIEAVGYEGVLKLLQKATGGNVDALGKLFTEQRGQLGMLGLLGTNTKTYKDILKDMEGATKGAGATAAAFAEQGKSISVQWDKAKAGITASAISLATTWFPTVEQAIGLASDFADWLDRLGKQKTVRAKVDFAVGGIGKALFGSAGKRVRVPIEGDRFEFQIQGASRGLADQMFGFLESSFSERSMFGSAGKRVRVPVEGGRFEWQITGAREGWLDALERELEGGIDEIDFSRVGKVLATTGSGLIQVAGVLAVSLAKLIGKAIRDVNWGEVGVELAKGMRQAVPKALDGLKEEVEATAADKLGGLQIGEGLEFAFEALPQTSALDDLVEAFDALTGEADAATGEVVTLDSQLAKLPDSVSIVFRDNADDAISRAEEYRFELARIPSQVTTTFTRVEEIRSSPGSPLRPQPQGPRGFGGPVVMGETYRVNERGPELFTPHASGRIDPMVPGWGGGPLVIQLDRAETRAFLEGQAVRAEPKISRRQGKRADLRSRTIS